MNDLRYALRMMLKRPGFTAIAIFTLALGIGANTAIFSVINAVLLRPLPFKESERLTTVWTSDARRPNHQGNVSYPNFTDFRQQSQSFDSLAAFRTTNFVLTGRDDPARLNGAVVTAELFALLGVAPNTGRDFQSGEDKLGANVVILSDALWRRRFNSDPEVVGQNITLDNRSFTVIGVMPPAFQFPIEAEPIDLWTTIAYDGSMATQRGVNYLEVIGRLKPGVSIEQARAEMDIIAQGLEQQYPDYNANRGVSLVPAFDQMVGDVRTPLLVIFGAVVFVLLIACANIANLLLARATARQHEMTVRSALGASRSRMIRQLITESLLLAFIGGVCGLVLALWGTDLLIALSPETIPRVADIRIDGRVLGFTFLVSLVTGVIFGLAPALHASKTELTEALKAGRGISEGPRRNLLRSGLVVAEVAIALVLMVGAGLLLNSFWRMLRIDTGFDSSNVLTFRLDLPDNKYSDPQVVSFYAQLQSRLQGLPGVRAASTSFGVPFGKSHIGTDVEIEGQPFAPGELPHADCHIITHDYFEALGIPFVKGRDFTERDDLNSRAVVIINESLARRYFPDEDPIGKRIRPDISATSDDPAMREIIGVVKDVKYRKLTADVEPEIYMPYAQMPVTTGMTMVIRTDINPRNLIGAARGEVQSLDRELPIFDVKTLDQYLGAAVAHSRFNALLLAIFASIALILTAIGLYGMMSYSVAGRTREIGIRSALGAQATDVLKLVIGHGLGLTLIGLLVGLGASLGLTRLMSELLFSVSATDPVTFALVSGVLILVALAACYLPARRAMRVDPVTAIRYE
jgi:putative ABC transport system permease protein